MSHLEEGLLHALLDGEVPSTELAPIQAHLAACADCRARLETERLLLAESAGLVELLEVPAGAPAAAGYAGPSRRRSWTRGLAWAASLVAALGLGYAAGILRPLERPDAGEDLAAAPPKEAPVVPAESTRRQSANPPADTQRSLAQRQPVSDVAAARDAPSTGAAAGGRAGAAGALGAEIAKRRAKPPADAAEAVADRKAEKVVATSSRPDSTPPAAAPVTALPPPAAAAASPVPQPLSVSRLREERVDQSRANIVGSLSAAPGAAAPPEPITLPDAVRRLGGSLRLIEGLVPLRLEAQGPYVRVVYRLAQGELVLSQQLIDGRVAYSLLAPQGFPADSLARLRARVRE